MNIKGRTRQLVLSAICIASGILIPIIFHFIIVGSGQIFLPMHIPILIGAFFLSPLFSLAVGILTPLLSGIITGMPPIIPMVPIMMAELGVAAFSISLLRKSKRLNIFLILVTGMILARLASGIMVYILMLVTEIRMHPIVYLKGAIITGLPGMLIQIILIPIIVNRLAFQHSNIR